MPRLRHGLGAEATVLTKKITSEGGLPDELQALVTRSSSAATRTIESKHQSKIILIEFLEVDKRLNYKFYLYDLSVSKQVKGIDLSNARSA
jgi:hypothetical protein